MAARPRPPSLRRARVATAKDLAQSRSRRLRYPRLCACAAICVFVPAAAALLTAVAHRRHVCATPSGELNHNRTAVVHCVTDAFCAARDPVFVRCTSVDELIDVQPATSLVALDEPQLAVGSSGVFLAAAALALVFAYAVQRRHIRAYPRPPPSDEDGPPPRGPRTQDPAETEQEDERAAGEERRRRLQAQSDAEEVEELLDTTRREQGEKRLAVAVVSCAVVSCAISALALSYTLS
eukprot:COSAG04_NODE_6791_length_1254_cov_3.495935_1_plen_237_part_00